MFKSQCPTGRNIYKENNNIKNNYNHNMQTYIPLQVVT